MLILLSLIYYVGISSCGMQGAEKSRLYKYNFDYVLFSAFLSSFGGGLVRDIFLLKTWPAVFKYNSFPDVTIALLSAILYITMRSNNTIKKIFKKYSFFSDALGLSQFISIGVNKALYVNCPFLIVILCGIVTALGGGVLSSIFCGYSLKKTILSNPGYKIITICGTLLYIYFIAIIDIDQNLSQAFLALYTLTTIVLCDFVSPKTIDIKKNTIHKLQSVNTIVIVFQSTQPLARYILPFPKHNHNIVYSNYLTIINKQFLKRFIFLRKKTIFLHRIRQM